MFLFRLNKGFYQQNVNRGNKLTALFSGKND